LHRSPDLATVVSSRRENEAVMSEQPHVSESNLPSAQAYDAWTLGRTRLVAFKAERLLTEAKRELGAFGETTLGTEAIPELLRASEHVSEALGVLEALQAELRKVGPT
jgi:hypothetical protein